MPRIAKKTEPPPTKGSRNSAIFAGIRGRIFFSALDLHPGYRSGLFADLIMVACYPYLKIVHTRFLVK